MVKFAKEQGMLEVKPEAFKEAPNIYCRIFAFLTVEKVTLTQALSNQFYKKITPKALLRRKVPTIPSSKRNDCLFESP